MYHVIKCDLQGRFIAVVTGLGHRKGTQDSVMPRSTAYRHAKALQQADRSHIYVAVKVSNTIED